MGCAGDSLASTAVYPCTTGVCSEAACSCTTGVCSASTESAEQLADMGRRGTKITQESTAVCRCQSAPRYWWLFPAARHKQTSVSATICQYTVVPTAGRHVSGIPPATRTSLRSGSGAESAQAASASAVAAAAATTSPCSTTTG